MSHDVFLSYTQPDRNLAFRVHELLQAQGLVSWIAVSRSNGVAAGRGFEEEIVAAIRASKVFVLVYSDYCNQSEHILAEVRLRWPRQPTVILRLDHSPFQKGLAYYLTGLQHIAVSRDDTREALRRLVMAVTGYVRGHEAGGGGGGGFGSGASGGHGAGGFGWGGLGFAVLALALVALGPGAVVVAVVARRDGLLFSAGMHLLRQKKYAEAAKTLRQHTEIAVDDAPSHFYWALAVIGGRKTRHLDGLVVKRLLLALEPFQGDREAPFIRVLLAILKQGYFALNGFKVPPPAVGELLRDVRLDGEKGAALLMHLDEPENDVWRQVAHAFANS